MNPSTGAVLCSCYVPTEPIADSGMGAVRAAADAVLGRTDAFTGRHTDVGISHLVNTEAKAPTDQIRATLATTTEIASPSKDSHMPGQPTMSEAEVMDHHQKKDGKR
jgi:hypothetical protein